MVRQRPLKWKISRSASPPGNREERLLQRFDALVHGVQDREVVVDTESRRK